MKIYLAFAAAALLSGAVFAQGESTSSIFDSLDTNRDGSLDQKEAQAHPTVAQAFTSADADGDGMLSREEFTSSFTTSQEQTPMPSPSDPQDTMPPEPQE